MKRGRRTILGLLFLAVPLHAQEFAERPEGGVWVMVNNLPGANQEVGKDLLTHFNLRKGPPARVCHPVQLFHLLEPNSIRSDAVLVLTDCGTLPLELADKIHRYMERGGRVIALGGTLFRNPVRARNGIAPTYEGLEWVTPASIEEEIGKAPLDRLLFDFDEITLAGASRNTNDPSHPTTYRIATDDNFGSVLHARIADHDGWESWVSPELVPLPEDSGTVLSFWARGGPDTTKLAVERIERDGSRWFATVPLEQRWKRFLLAEKDFAYWESIPSRSPTRFRSEKAVRIAFGLALTHTGWLTGDHEFQVAEVGVSPATAYVDIDWGYDFPPREMLHPHTMTYECSDVGALLPCPEQALIAPIDRLRPPDSVRAYPPRPRAAGWNTGRKQRWVPLLDAVSPSGDYRGTVAALRIGENLEAMWAGVSIEDPEFYRQEPMLEFTRLLAIRMIYGQFLWEAGSTQSTYFPDQPIRFGARVLPPQTTQVEAFMRVAISDRISGRVLRLRDYPKGKLDVISATGEECTLEPGKEYVVTATLIQDAQFTGQERPVDRIEQPLRVWEPDKSLPWIEVDRGGFRLEGEPWRAYGVNYMPSSGISLHDGAAFEFWLGSKGYEPEVVDRDLRRIAGMGMNMVSVFLYHRSLESNNLLDFLSRCEQHKLRVNLSLRPGTPLDFPWKQVKEMIERNRLAENPTVFAFDLAWEPNFRDREDRRAHLAEWNEWIVRTHGSVGEAFESWRFRPGMRGELVDVPSSEQWFESGEWNGMVGDYSHFLREFLGGKYREARRLVKSIAPRQLVSFRMQFTGDPTFRGPETIPYEAESFVDAVDLWEPEAYGRVGDWNRVRPGIFTAAYLRGLNPRLPVFWSEIGQSSWDPSLGRSTEDSMERVARYYEDFHRMLMDSQADGVAFWWYPGGFRANENSDYGILNPDGTDRPVTRVIREWGPRFLDAGENLGPDGWIDLDQDWAPGGIVGRYEKVEENFWNRIEAGERVGIRFVSEE